MWVRIPPSAEFFTTRSTTAVRRAYTSQALDEGGMMVRIHPGGIWWVNANGERDGCEPSKSGFDSHHSPHFKSWAKCYGRTPGPGPGSLGSIPSTQTSLQFERRRQWIIYSDSF